VGRNNFEYIPSFALRALKDLWIGYEVAA
jgi:hypothetical protein